MNYKEAEQQYKKARNKDKGKKLSGNTYLYKDGEDYCVKLHQTVVIRIKPDNTYILNSGGWFTPTTKDRLNTFTSKDISIYQKNKVWYFNNGEEFFDGIIVTENGEVLNPLPKDETENLDKKRKQLNKIISNYIKGFCLAIKSGQIGFPSGGDCWYCCMTTEDGQTMGDTFNDVSHILSHLNEQYYVPSLLFNAFKESTDNPEFVFQYTLTNKSDWNTRTTLRRYFKIRFNELLKLI